MDNEVEMKVKDLFAEDPNTLVKRLTIEMNPATNLPERIVVDKKQMVEPQGTEEEKALMTYDTSVTNILEIKLIVKQ